MQDAEYWIDKLSLKPHPEGGHFRETYRCRDTVPGDALPDRYAGSRSISTAIYYLLRGHDVSAFHRIKSDEVWHFHAGSPLTVHVIDDQGNHNTVRLGLTGECLPQAVVPA